MLEVLAIQKQDYDGNFQSSGRNWCQTHGSPAPPPALCEV